ncbi:MAG: hypothetical protein K6G48_04585 [Acholeplasmatales bacterium]|nr:hypothetical protein [Acholeplasmatales bacterium]
MNDKGLTKIYLMVITIPKGKKEIIADMLSRHDVVAYAQTMARGSIDKGYTKNLMFCIIKEDRIKDAILALEDRFKSFRSNISMVYTIPLDSIIGVSSYITLSNGGNK